jgi:LmbE family N-acetylglucosaminyl deacetylase
MRKLGSYFFNYLIGSVANWFINGKNNIHWSVFLGHGPPLVKSHCLPNRFVYATFTHMEMQGKTILAVGAHPDDLEFFAGGTIAKFVSEGATAYYLILTDGSKGSEDHELISEELCQVRRDEQRQAAEILGVKNSYFFDFVDGELENTLAVRKKIVEVVRKLKPDVVITFDPSYLYDADWGMVNHPDHRAAGQATIDAVFPFSRNRRTFPELYEQGHDVHHVTELLLINLKNSNYEVEISDFIEQKLNALAKHVSQKDDSEPVLNQAKKICTRTNIEEGRFFECFVKIILA